MKKLLLIVLFCLCLAGCSRTVWESVEDAEAAETASWQDETYLIQLGLPDGVSLLEERDNWKLYGTKNEELEIMTGKFLASDLDNAVQTLSGFGADRLTILEKTKFDLPEYQFAWVTQTDGGCRVCRASLVMDGTDCYAIVCSRPEEDSDYDRQIRQVFSTFGLCIDEGV